jgi:hypothetical protein
MTDHDKPEPNKPAARRQTVLSVHGAVWSVAANCRLFESDPGPAYYTESPAAPEDHPDDVRTVSRAEAWRDIYARGLIHDLDANPHQLREGANFAAARLREVSRPAHHLALARKALREAPDRRTGIRKALHLLSPTEYADDRAFWRLAVELCTRALDITRAAGADTDPFDRDRLLAGIDHRLHLVFGIILDPDASPRLVNRLHEIDRQAEADRRLPPDHPDKRRL